MHSVKRGYARSIVFGDRAWFPLGMFRNLLSFDPGRPLTALGDPEKSEGCSIPLEWPVALSRAVGRHSSSRYIASMQSPF